MNKRSLTALACVAALGLPPVAVLASAPAATAAPTSTVFLTATTSTVLPTAKAMATAVPGTAKSATNAIGTSTGWIELWAQGSTGQRTAGSAPPPSGHGYVIPQVAGTTTPAGAWAPSITLSATGKPTIVPTVRMYKRSSTGAYTLIASAKGSRTALTTTPKTIALPAVSAAGVTWEAGDQLYLDLLAKVVKAASSATGGVAHYDDGGMGQSVTHPTTTATPAPNPSPDPSPSPTTTPSSPGFVWRPAPGTSWQWQITGTLDESLDVAMYDIDLYDAQATSSSYTVPGFGTVNVPKGDNAGAIARLKAKGKVVICYLDTGAWENYRPDASLFPATVIGNTTGWSGERWLDIRAAAWPQFKPLIEARLDLAVRSGCDGVEPDQNNPWGNRPGFTIGLADQKAWYLEVARMAHERGLSVGQKNGIETTDADTIAAFDWNLNEECNMYDECDVLTGFIKAGKAVFQVEYTDEDMTYDTTCPANNNRNFDGLLKTLDLDAWRQPCR